MRDRPASACEFDFWLWPPHTGIMSQLPDSEPAGRMPRLPALPKSKRKATEKKGIETADTTGRRTWRGYVVWGIVALLGVGAAAEFRAQMGYRKALSTCQAALEKIEGKNASEARRINFDELKESLPSNPVYTTEIQSFTRSGVYTWTWQGLRRYKVHLIVSPKDGTVWDVKSEP